MLVALVAVTAGPAVAASKYASIVMDARSGVVLHAENADARRYPASLTKVMTLYLTFEALDSGKIALDDKITASARAAGQAPSKLGLRAGDRLTVEQAILALVTKSANDVATALAEELGGTESGFAGQMTKKAQALGMKGTRFKNASGLPDPNQYTTARDMAILSKRIMDDYPQYYSYFATTSFTYRGVTHRTHNRLLGAVSGVDGIKTGYTRASGFNLTTSAKRSSAHLIGVVLGGRTSRTRDAHMREILEEQFSRVARNPNLLPKSTAVASAKGRVNHERLALALPRVKPGSDDPLAALALLPTPKPTDAIETLVAAVETAPIEAAPIEAAPIESVDALAFLTALADVPNAPRPKPGSDWLFAVEEEVELAEASTDEDAFDPGEGEAAQGDAELLLAALEEIDNAPRPSPETIEALVAAPAPAPIPVPTPTVEAEPVAPVQTAAVLPAPKPIAAAEPGAGPRFQIQIGAFALVQSAEARIADAAAQLPQVLSAELGRVMPLKLGESTVYRARFGPLADNDATRACTALKSKGFTCIRVPLPPDQDVAWR